jgi:hypothetical protein
MQVPQDITLGLLWPKYTHKYCIQTEIIKYKGKVPVKKKLFQDFICEISYGCSQRTIQVFASEEPS